MKYFYCSKCNTEIPNFFIEKEELMIRETWLNPRDFFSKPIHHIICPYCGYVLSGYIEFNNGNEEDIMDYVKYTIGLYTIPEYGLINFKDLDYICENEIRKKRIKFKDTNNEEIKNILKTMCK